MGDFIINGKTVASLHIGGKEVIRIADGQTVLWEKFDDYFRIVNVDSVSGDITFPQNATSLEYNIDGGAWVNPSTSSVTITLQPNEVLNMRAKSGSPFKIGEQVMTCTFLFDVEGNLATLLNGQNPDSVTTIPSDFCRGWFRGQTKIRYADKLHLGTITTLGYSPLLGMFRYSSLVKGMDLSNITAFTSKNGIQYLYYGCWSLIQATAPSVINIEDNNMLSWLGGGISTNGICICPNAYVYNNMPTNSSTTNYGIPSGWTKSYDCRNWQNEGYEDKGRCDCEFNYAAEGYTDEDECLCTEYQECTVQTPTISFENGVYQDVCQKFNGNGTVTITCPQSGVTIYYRYVTQTCVNNVPTFADITQESWNVYSNAITLTNYKSCGTTNGQYKIQAKATKSGMDDSLIAESVVTVYTDQGPCNCTDDFYVMGYDSEGECYCTESGDNMGYETLWDCMCNEYQECPEPVDCEDCNNYAECGYESYMDCDCQLYCRCTDCTNWENLGYESLEDCECQANSNCTEVDCTDCNNYGECGYESYVDCDCQLYGRCTDCTNWENLGYESLEDCECQANSNCTEVDCTDCNNYGECGYESYVDCDCQLYGRCTDCTNWENLGYESMEDCECQANSNCTEEP